MNSIFILNSYFHICMIATTTKKQRPLFSNFKMFQLQKYSICSLVLSFPGQFLLSTWNKITNKNELSFVCQFCWQKKRLKKNNNQKYTGRRSRHPLKCGVFLRICTTIETVTRFYHMIWYLFQSPLFYITSNYIDYGFSWWIHYYMGQECSDLQACIYHWGINQPPHRIFSAFPCWQCDSVISSKAHGLHIKVRGNYSELLSLWHRKIFLAHS